MFGKDSRIKHNCCIYFAFGSQQVALRIVLDVSCVRSAQYECRRCIVLYDPVVVTLEVLACSCVRNIRHDCRTHGAFYIAELEVSFISLSRCDMGSVAGSA